MAAKGDQTSRAMDVAARSIDLLAVLTKASQTAEIGVVTLREISNWLGREGLDENELKFFLESTRALARPNNQAEVVNFFKAIIDRKPKRLIVPLSARPSGALGRLISTDPYQQWITSTISCLFRYHDERFIKHVLCNLIMQKSHEGSKPLSEYQLEWHPDTLRLGDVVNKVIHSNWLHIANAGIIGSPGECPHLPEELQWACEKGHNVESYKLAVIITKLLDPPREVIVQSEHLLTNLVLWLIWHFGGHLRIVVSGEIKYDKHLGPKDNTVECRVLKSCPKGKDKECTASKSAPTFQMLENVAGSLKTLFSGKYDSRQTLKSEPRVRQKLYHSPFQYPKGSQNSIKIQTQCTAQEILRWFVERPVSRVPHSSRLEFLVSLASSSESPSDLRIGDLLGRTPGLLNTQCGELGRAFVVFSLPRQLTPSTDDNPMDESSNGDEDMEDESVAFDRRPQVLLMFFPILQDLIESVGQSCRCYSCHRQSSCSNFSFDENCLQHKAFMDVMCYFAHGIADAFGAPDVSSYTETRAGDYGATAILLDVIDNVRFDHRKPEGLLRWDTLLSTSAQVFLGCPPLDQLTDATHNDASVDTSPNFMQHLSSTVVAIQYGDLAVVVPWLDISQRLSTRGCFRFTVAEGQLGVPVDEELGRMQFQALARDVAVIETQHTEDVSDYVERYKMSGHASSSHIEVFDDQCEALCAYVLVSVDRNRYKLLMRVSSKLHSRMVDPSRSMLKLSQGVFNIRCNHQATRSGIVPDGHTVELYEFDDLLGRWGDTTGRQSISEDNSSESSGTMSDEEKENSETEGNVSLSNTVAEPNMKKPEQARSSRVQPLCVSHVLGSSFKYNTALALMGDGPVFINRGDSCLTCSLERAADFKTENGTQNHGRWIVNKVRDPVRQLPRSTPRLKGSRKAGLLEDASRIKSDDGSGLGVDVTVMEIVE
ncbi:hypothetical protein K469DRAFT_713652 [Zopfia rhizophila CBS 207.26]|uniref:Uncharacterized protein n=1 Tax=Zopfia rhizophila CBS 207.26 TaxID=1314779 RepID=A0A6A6DPS9_9PEZI|nr:hypothetical protein K469DRAFT_713652 [Zopfia rhizophila CBS 207.26]